MKYQAMERLRLAWRWLPLELLSMIACLVIGWGASALMDKPVYQNRTDIQIRRRLPHNASKQRRSKQLKKDVENVGQFSVMPHQSWVLYQASEYAYTHYGIWQPVQDLSESVSAKPISKRPVLRITVSSSSRAIAEENGQAFKYAVTKPLKSLSHYEYKVVSKPTVRVTNSMRKPVLKLMFVIGLALAVSAPYVVHFIRGKERDENDQAT